MQTFKSKVLMHLVGLQYKRCEQRIRTFFSLLGLRKDLEQDDALK